MAEDKALKLRQLFNAIDPDRVTKSDMKVLIDAIVERLEARDQELAEKAAMLADAMEAAKQALEASTNDTRSTLQSETQTTLSGAISALQERINQWEERIAAVKDGETPDIDEVAKLAAGLIQLPEYRAPIMPGPQETRDMLELIEDEEEKLSERAVRGLAALIEEVQALKKKSQGGSSVLSVSHFPRHESFTMNGSDTTVTLAQAPAANGTAIFGLRYNGQTQVFGTDYTVSGNKITFVTFTPEASTIIDVSYMP